MRYLIIFFGLLFALEIKPLTKPIYDLKKAKLGEKLFFDKTLSRNNDISCNSCHNVKNYGVDNMRFSIGSGGVVDKPMNTPSVYNVVNKVAFFWNGRAESLEDQIIESFTNPNEHNLTKNEVVKRVKNKRCYVEEFKKLYGKDPTIKEIAEVIAEYEKSLVTLNSRFDRYLMGEEEAINEQEKRGYFKFKIYGCITCHNGANVGDNSFQKVGIFLESIKLPRGLDRFFVTKFEDDKYVYKVPSLRNVEKTFPYFHDGSVMSLEEAIILMGKFNLGITIPQEDVNDIKAFLKTLTGEIK